MVILRRQCVIPRWNIYTSDRYTIPYIFNVHTMYEVISTHALFFDLPIECESCFVYIAYTILILLVSFYVIFSRPLNKRLVQRHASSHRERIFLMRQESMMVPVLLTMTEYGDEDDDEEEEEQEEQEDDHGYPFCKALLLLQQPTGLGGAFETPQFTLKGPMGGEMTKKLRSPSSAHACSKPFNIFRVNTL